MKEPGFEVEREMLELIDQRDRAEEYADKLADVVAALLGVELGEHSSGNNPWQAALDAYNERPPASPASAPVGKVYHCDPDNGRDDGEMAAEFNCRLPEGTKLYASPQLVLGEPVVRMVVDKDGRWSRNLNHQPSLTFRESPNLVDDMNRYWPANAPHRSVPLYASHQSAIDNAPEPVAPLTKLVPVEPTEEMMQAGYNTGVLGYQLVYRAMLYASPPPPTLERVKKLRRDAFNKAEDGNYHSAYLWLDEALALLEQARE